MTLLIVASLASTAIREMKRNSNVTWLFIKLYKELIPQCLCDDVKYLHLAVQFANDFNNQQHLGRSNTENVQYCYLTWEFSYFRVRHMPLIWLKHSTKFSVTFKCGSFTSAILSFRRSSRYRLCATVSLVHPGQLAPRLRHSIDDSQSNHASAKCGAL